MDDDLVSIREESAYEAFSQFTIDDEDDECQMEEFDKLYGTGDPEQHLNPFTGVTAHKEILLFQQFPLSLTNRARLKLVQRSSHRRHTRIGLDSSSSIFINHFQPLTINDEPDIVMCAMVETTKLLDEDPP